MSLAKLIVATYIRLCVLTFGTPRGIGSPFIVRGAETTLVPTPHVPKPCGATPLQGLNVHERRGRGQDGRVPPPGQDATIAGRQAVRHQHRDHLKVHTHAIHEGELREVPEDTELGARREDVRCVDRRTLVGWPAKQAIPDVRAAGCPTLEAGLVTRPTGGLERLTASGVEAADPLARRSLV